MNQTPSTPSPIIEMGEKYYQENLAKVLEPQNIGKFLVLDVETQDYEVDSDHIIALQRLRARHPGRVFYATRVGYRTLGTIGGQRKAL